MPRTVWWAAALLVVAVPVAAQAPPVPAAADSSNPMLSVLPVTPTAPDFPRGRISGLMFGDAYYNVNGNPTHAYDAKGADAGQVNVDGKNPITRDLNGAQMRRMYFQLDNDISIRYSTRFLLEGDGKELTSGGKLAMYVKQAYFQAKSVLPRTDFYFGELKTPFFENSEDVWGYRAVEKTLADFWGIAPSSDLGLELKGFADPDHHVGYVAMIGDGPGQKPETDRFKAFYTALPLRFGDLRVEPDVDYQPVRVNLGPRVKTHTDSLAVNNDQATYKLFVAYDFRRATVGAEGLVRVNHAVPSSNTTEPRGLSVFGRGTVTPTLGGFARVDVWIPDQRAASRVDTRMFILGADWQPSRDVHVMPNIEATQYRAIGSKVAPPYHDLQARVTFFYRYSKPQS